MADYDRSLGESLREPYLSPRPVVRAVAGRTARRQVRQTFPASEMKRETPVVAAANVLYRFSCNSQPNPWPQRSYAMLATIRAHRMEYLRAYRLRARARAIFYFWEKRVGDGGETELLFSSSQPRRFISYAPGRSGISITQPRTLKEIDIVHYRRFLFFSAVIIMMALKNHSHRRSLKSLNLTSTKLERSLP